ncbi:unnamed protein product [Fusarium graminearum]|uniref:Chromosome 3, complete genome n=1 Tax=Gibberella zeae (strain ATCC MYA-4620 / CBS 123657 / FGSC 9075 / NRRL 31084 / PH-1) TaxID=229533 RepID=A0A098E0X5_GIBZE|nr:unnamed protein product [Fusarium graminearum]CZS85377.1 unnamed protein product [Fusarium graminearum]
MPQHVLGREDCHMPPQAMTPDKKQREERKKKEKRDTTLGGVWSLADPSQRVAH